ncbi:MAG: tetratricopeptide repeat protein [Pirellulales bacterium]|nr:tetratricopeptide repeat protein [Pirellulales bacterium]
MKRPATPRKHRKDTARSARRAPDNRRRRLPWVLPIAVVVCAVILGWTVARPLWTSGNTGRAGPSEIASAVRTPAAGGAAAGPGGATAEPEAIPPVAEPPALPPKPGLAGPEAASPEPVPAPSQPAESPRSAEDYRQESFEVAEQLRKDFPGSTDPIVLLGMVHNWHGGTSEAMTCWEQALQRNPNRADVYKNMGMVARQNDELDKAVELWRKAAALQPKIPDLYNLLGETLMDLGRLEEAAAVLEKDIELFPRTTQSHAILGHTYLQLKEPEKAKEHYEKGVALYPKDWNAYYGLARVCATLGQRDEARQYSQQFKKLRDADLEVHDARRTTTRKTDSVRQILANTHTHAGQIYRAHRHAWKAERHFCRAAELDSENKACRRELASLYEQNNRNAEALEVCEQLVRINPKNAMYHLNVGVLNARLQRFDDARTAIEKALDLEPDNPQFKQTYESIPQR